MAVMYGVGQVFEDGTIKETNEIKYFKYFADAEEYCIRKMYETKGWLYARSPYLAIFTREDGIITKIEYLKYTSKDVNIKINLKADEI